MKDIPRSEHPRPQSIRNDWINLNGEWTFTFDFSRSGKERKLNTSDGFSDTILVPYCPESRLSGVHYTDFIEEMWYHRFIEIPKEWIGKKILLHFGGIDYRADIFIDGVPVTQHWGGASSFTVDITNAVESGKQHNLVVRVRDFLRAGNQPSGKQRPEYEFKTLRAHYTRTTGIWSTVWLEAVHPYGLESCAIIPDLDRERFVFVPLFHAAKKGNSFRINVLSTGSTVAEIAAPQCNGVPIEVPLREGTEWEPGSPFLYDIELKVVSAGGELLDTVSSYGGLRKIHIEENRIFLNNKSLYTRFVLDQGFYPDGLWTAPSDEDLKNDILLSMQAGFNGARLHQKVFDERFHYWADTLGYLTWAESPSWGVNPTDVTGARNFLSEWRELVVRDRNHPSIMAWTPLNETRHIEENPEQHYRFHRDVYDTTRALDPTRPVNETSGYIHVKTDLFTVHTYEQDPKKLKEELSPNQETGVFRRYPKWEATYNGQPYLVDEFGGILWIPEDRKPFLPTSWGYGEAPKTEDEFFKRLEGQVETVLSFDHICGYCYTQLTDVEQEQNGIYTYDRSEKFDMKKIKRIFSKKPDGYHL